MRDLYPGYDVLSKRATPSWNRQTREVIGRRLAIDPEQHVFFDDAEWETLKAICGRIVPQSTRALPIPVAAIVDQKIHESRLDGFRDARLPSMGEAWRRGLAALDQETRSKHGRRFHEIEASEQDDLLRAMEKGELTHSTWQGMPSNIFFKQRVADDIVRAYYMHPTAWNEIGWGGPASPRGYVRMDFDRRDPWEAAEATPGREAEALRENRRVGRGIFKEPHRPPDDPHTPRARYGTRPTSSAPAHGRRCASTRRTKRSISRSSARARVVAL